MIRIYLFSVHVPYIRVDRNEVEVYSVVLIFWFIHLFVAQNHKARDPNASDPFAVLQHKTSSQSALYIYAHIQPDERPQILRHFHIFIFLLAIDWDRLTFP